MRAVLIGNYGVGNFGDEALKEYFVSAFPDIAWDVVSAERGARLPRLPFGLHSLFTPWWRTLRALRRCDAVVFGGGTLFTDIESPKACLLWWWHAFAAHRCGKPFLLAFQGIGPFRTKRGERRARWAVQNAAHVSVRDDASLERAKRWRNDVTRTFDPALSYFADFMGPVRHGGKTLIVIPRENSTDMFFLKAKQRKADARFTGARILSFKPDDPSERAVCDRLSADLGGAPIVAVRTVADIERGFLDASLVLTQRYHGAIAALAGGVPFETVSQGAGDKLSTMSGVSGDELSALMKAGKEALYQRLSPATLRS